MTTLMFGAASFLASTRLGAALLVLGEPAIAAKAFEAALAAKAGLREAELGLVEAKLAQGEPLAALERLTPILARAEAGEDGARDAWWLAAQAARTLGSDDDAELFLTRARAANVPFLAWHRAEACVGRPGAAVRSA